MLPHALIVDITQLFDVFPNLFVSPCPSHKLLCFLQLLLNTVALNIGFAQFLGAAQATSHTSVQNLPGPCKVQESFKEWESQRGGQGKSFGKKSREEGKNQDARENVPRMEFI